MFKFSANKERGTLRPEAAATLTKDRVRALNVSGGIMRLFLILLSFFTFQVIADERADFERLINLTDKTEFLQFKENIVWIKKSPTVTYIEKDDRDIFGNGRLATVKGYDCDHDGKIDEPPKCAILYKELKKYFETH
ncbi:hypothetical protein [Rheinheimera sp. F8]|uniref:hypothetical protein n=1 Tax=Rheinheimera sp. F8 TaxID=1763998 RepID=UPI000744BBB0|nr:hypothetical protein [Rheinheimera sp. F8]ALZ75288.1 hypothetical protein ATY27_05645 [Rheinheimera sp. F8]ALZ76286.1 hypothetical protein ATY27_11300 [Rheinheimera sp. F8]